MSPSNQDTCPTLHSPGYRHPPDRPQLRPDHPTTIAALLRSPANRVLHPRLPRGPGVAAVRPHDAASGPGLAPPAVRGSRRPERRSRACRPPRARSAGLVSASEAFWDMSSGVAWGGVGCPLCQHRAVAASVAGSGTSVLVRFAGESPGQGDTRPQPGGYATATGCSRDRVSVGG